MSRTRTSITPADQGRRMSLAEFNSAEGQDGRLYELSRGRVTVVDVPNIRHFAQVDEIREQLSGYRRAHPGKIYRVGTGSECKIIVPGAESERHPDLAVYKTPPPDEDVWSVWVPQLVIEVVSPASADRDYNEKPDEYLSFGVTDYWVIDADRGQRGEALLHCRRAGKWAQVVMRPPQRCTTRQLPGFELDLTAVFAAARSAGAETPALHRTGCVAMAAHPRLDLHDSACQTGCVMSRTIASIGPADQGRHMTLEEFEPAQGLEGRLYELGRGTVSVVDVPHPRHLAQLTAIRRQLSAYDLANPGRIHTIATGSECKILIQGLQSERHPDLAIYKTPPPEQDVWSTWIPELVIEIVSPGSEERDYIEKPGEYLAFGVAEYWIIDLARGEGGEALMHRRRAGKWVHTVVRPPGVCRTRQLPGFELDLTPVFTAARSVPG